MGWPIRQLWRRREPVLCGYSNGVWRMRAASNAHTCFPCCPGAGAAFVWQPARSAWGHAGDGAGVLFARAGAAGHPVKDDVRRNPLYPGGAATDRNVAPPQSRAPAAGQGSHRDRDAAVRRSPVRLALSKPDPGHRRAVCSVAGDVVGVGFAARGAVVHVSDRDRFHLVRAVAHRHARYGDGLDAGAGDVAMGAGGASALGRPARRARASGAGGGVFRPVAGRQMEWRAADGGARRAVCVATRRRARSDRLAPPVRCAACRWQRRRCGWGCGR